MPTFYAKEPVKAIILGAMVVIMLELNLLLIYDYFKPENDLERKLEPDKVLRYMLKKIKENFLFFFSKEFRDISTRAIEAELKELENVFALILIGARTSMPMCICFFFYVAQTKCSLLSFFLAHYWVR